MQKSVFPIKSSTPFNFFGKALQNNGKYPGFTFNFNTGR